MKKKGYFEYDPVIYPRKLWVHIGSDFKDVASSAFDGIILPDEDEEYGGVTFEKAERKSDRRYGILVSFPSKKDMTMGNVCHESNHVVDAIEKATGIDHGGEPSAYLYGWVASCINKARLGQGVFVDVLIGEPNGKTDNVRNDTIKRLELGDIVSCSTDIGEMVIGRYEGIKGDYVVLQFCVTKGVGPASEWKLRQVDGKCLCVRIERKNCVGLSHANKMELEIYSVMMKKPDNETKN